MDGITPKEASYNELALLYFGSKSFFKVGRGSLYSDFGRCIAAFADRIILSAGPPLQSLRVAPFRSFPWLEAKGVTGSLIGLNAAAYAASAMVSVMTIDQLTARVGENRVIAAALLGCSIGLAALAMNDSLPVWFIARFAIGFCASLFPMLDGAWLNTASPQRIRGRISGFFGAGMFAGFAAGPLKTPFLALLMVLPLRWCLLHCIDWHCLHNF
ncbi:MFS transporter [Brucella sp.]|uniref:MFS transporter n=1 Tax=Brucella sp. TaxID=52132 RepID=UPI002898B303|nr:MFS transporter [Brucella sp.]